MNVIDTFFEKINNLPMLPKVVQDVMQLLNSGEVDIKVLTNVIHRDQVLAAKVLRMSNSAYFGCSRSIKTIEDAVALIGLQNLNTLVIASGVTTTFTEVQGLDLKKFWQHHLVTASVARQLSKQLELSTETAYVAGLLHGIGRLPIHMVFPVASAQVEQVCQGRLMAERQSVEQSMLGIDHCQVGDMLAKHWNFPEEICCVIRSYIKPCESQLCQLASVVYAAAHIAHELALDRTSTEIAESLDAEVATMLSMQDKLALTDCVESCRPMMDEASSYL